MRAFGWAVVLVSVLPVTAQSLGDRIDDRIRRSAVRNAHWAVHVEDADGRVLHSRNGDRLMIPASVRKLFTAATVASCHDLGSQYETELWLSGRVDGEGVLHGNLIIRGVGDPSLGARYEARTTDIFEPWIEAVRDRGIRMVNGGVVADVSAFDGVHYPGSWKYDNIGESYAPPIDALAFNENGVGVFLTAYDCRRYWVMTDPWFVPISADTNCSASSLSVRTADENVLRVYGNAGRSRPGERFTTIRSITDPGLYAAQAFTASLESAGIATIAEPRVARDREQGSAKLGIIASPPLYTLVGTMLEQSSNLFAEMMYKAVSAEDPASWAGAHVTERGFLTGVVGLASDSFSFDDGSGLAVENYVTAEATVGLLRWMTTPERRGLWQELLASPGESGTLRRRLGNFSGRLWGKTGTLDGVRALAGYLERPDGEVRYFAIFVNNYSVAAWQAGEVIDQIVQEIDR